MADGAGTASDVRVADGVAGASGREPRRLRVVGRRRGLPGSRAVVGALLVSAAAVGLFAAYARTTAAPSHGYVVMARSVRAGDPIERADLAVVRMDLPQAVRVRAFDDPNVLVGATALGPLETGELVQAAGVIRKRGGPASTEMAVPIEASRVSSGIKPGERVDLMATFGTGTDAFTAVLVRNAQVLSLDRARGSLGGESGAIVLTLALAGRDEAPAVAHASRAAQMSVVSTTGAPPPTGPPVYRPTVTPNR